MAARTKTSRTPDGARPAKPGLHPRNRHASGYDFPRLLAVDPGLRSFVQRNAYGNDSVDFADPEAVKALNRALLMDAYDIRGWDLPPGCLCPPIPGRADYLHHLADLLATCNGGVIPRGPAIHTLDVGVGASAIYPLIGHREYGWSFVGADTDATALASAARVLAANAGLPQVIALRRQTNPARVFDGIVEAGERFDVTLCNPPFYASAREAKEAAQLKWRKLGRGGSARNFGGQGGELWCAGGETGFVTRMIQESQGLADRVAWFTTLISASGHLPAVNRALRQAEARDIRTVTMAQGQKQSRFVAWSFLEPTAMKAWAQARWRPAPGEAP
jgi:23S rRNA (adenine1618-N6)-methyltransferase